jgi:hypothetical protein
VIEDRDGGCLLRDEMSVHVNEHDKKVALLHERVKRERDTVFVALIEEGREETSPMAGQREWACNSSS